MPLCLEYTILAAVTPFFCQTLTKKTSVFSLHTLTLLNFFQWPLHLRCAFFPGGAQCDSSRLGWIPSHQPSRSKICHGKPAPRSVSWEEKSARCFFKQTWHLHSAEELKVNIFFKCLNMEEEKNINPSFLQRWSLVREPVQRWAVPTPVWSCGQWTIWWKRWEEVFKYFFTWKVLKSITCCQWTI